MDNKNDKTFADLFSSVSSGDHQSDNDPKQDIQKKDDGIIFDGQDTLNMNSLLKKDTTEEEKRDIGHFIAREEEIPVSFGKVFFDMKDTDSSEGEKENQVVEEKIDDSGNSSSIFDKEENKKAEHDEANQLSSNIFFGQMNEVDSQQLEAKKVDVVPENTSILSDENPFFQNPPKSDDGFLSERVDDIFNKNQESKTDNPFFQKNLSTKENEVEEVSNSSYIVSEEKVEKTIEPEEPKSVSPFFVDNALEEQANFLGIDKINLVENNHVGKNIGTIDASKSKHFNVKIVKKKEPFIKFILGVISYAIFILLLLIGITLLVYVLDIKIRAAKGDYSAPKFNAYVVLTGSMLPAIQVKDVVVTKKTDPSQLEVGDVITFASADSRFLNTVITHRIIKKSYDAKSKTYSFQTMGDNNNVADGALVPQNNIFGKVILKIPKLGYLQEFLATDGGWILVILVPCLTVISYDIVKLIKGLKRKKYKNITVQR